MIQLLLVLHVAVARLVPVPTTIQPDSIVAERLVDTMPRNGVRRIPIVMKQGLAPGDPFNVAFQALQQDGFFQLSPEAITAACGADVMTGNRLSLRLRDNATWRELVIPDTCGGGSPEVRKQLTELCTVALSVIARREIDLHAQPSKACKQ